MAEAHPLSIPLQDGVRFFPRPLPTPLWARLTAGFPLRERYGLTTFRPRTMDEEGSACSPVAHHLREAKGDYLLLATYLLVQA